MPSIVDLTRLLDKDPNDPFVLYGLAQEYFKLKDTPKAVEFYNRCLKADPSYCYAYFHKARALQAAGDIEHAKVAVTDGLAAARKAGDQHAVSELSALQDELDE
jgi:predicted Zn-dependent protease